MFQRLGKIVGRAPLVVVLAWFLLAIIAAVTAPEWSLVTLDGEFVFLPEDSPSRRAEELYREAFPPPDVGASDQENEVAVAVQQDPLGSNIVLVVRRTHEIGTGLHPEDKEFVEDVLKPELETIAARTSVGYEFTPVDEAPELPPDERIIKGIWTFTDRKIGPLLDSEDGLSTLVVVELRTEFLDRGNTLVVARVEDLIDRLNQPRTPDAPKIPTGLEVKLSGSATVGRDMLRAEHISASRTEAATKLLVIVLLLIIYRAPLLAAIPLLTVGMAVNISISLLRIMAGWGWVGLFTGLEVYVTIVVYGAGVDYCLFLIARYKEELDGGASFDEAIARSIDRVGIALATSAGTSICGIGMMMFAQFGKFQQAGFAISFGLFVVLCCALTFTAALMRLCGRWAFWPDIRRERLSADDGWVPASTWTSFLADKRWLERGWERMAQLVSSRPGTIFLLTFAAMLPLAVVGVATHDHLSYGLLSDLPQNEPSVRGAAAVQQHFPAGVTGISTVLIRHDDLDLTPATGERLAGELTDVLEARADELGIVDIRSQANPLGLADSAREYLRSVGRRVAQRVAIRAQAARTYSSPRGPQEGKVARLDLVLAVDPFSRDSIQRLSRVHDAIRDALPAIASSLGESLPDDFAESAEIFMLGPTASVRDIKAVTDHDRMVIDILVVVAVYLVLVALLGRPAICAYLIVTVVFSFLVAMGATYLVFQAIDGETFAGLDWKIPIFLFTLLIAMGEDYNILLMARVQEEQQTHGPVKGVLVALSRTGSIISSCGIIMAGTFSSLMTGTLRGMVQMGFALTFGVLLDTFVIRPILVPAYLVLLHRGRFGVLGRWLGARPEEIEPQMPGELTEREPSAAVGGVPGFEGVDD